MLHIDKTDRLVSLVLLFISSFAWWMFGYDFARDGFNTGSALPLMAALLIEGCVFSLWVRDMARKKMPVGRTLFILACAYSLCLAPILLPRTFHGDISTVPDEMYPALFGGALTAVHALLRAYIACLAYEQRAAPAQGQKKTQQTLEFTTPDGKKLTYTEISPSDLQRRTR